MAHEIPPDVRNSDLTYCIDEYVRKQDHRDMLKDHWYHGYTIEELAEKYQVSATTVKKVLYDIGDNILLRAVSIS